jgi:hypothetical protein
MEKSKNHTAKHNNYSGMQKNPLFIRERNDFEQLETRDLEKRHLNDRAVLVIRIEMYIFRWFVGTQTFQIKN